MRKIYNTYINIFSIKLFILLVSLTAPYIFNNITELTIANLHALPTIKQQDISIENNKNMIYISKMQSVSENDHIKLVPYKPNALYNYQGFYGVATILIFEKNETIQDMIMGDTSAWAITNLGDKLLLKPVGEQTIAETNAIIFTSKNRIYHFTLSAVENDNILSKDVPYEIRFIYSKAPVNKFKDVISKIGDITKIDIKNARYLNFNYRVSGDSRIMPVKIFDNQNFTFFQFPADNTSIPAIFLVDSTGYEELINFKVVGKYIVVERVAARFTLRDGTDTVCVFNESMPYRLLKQKEKKTSFIGS